MISLSDAYSILFAQTFSPKINKIPLFQAFGKILAQDVQVVRNLPAFSNSAMDGYAISDLHPSYTLQGTILAGDQDSPTLLPKHCLKIMTGAKIPSNTLAILPFEQTQTLNDQVIPLQPIKTHQHIRFCGEDYQKGDLLLQAKKRLDFAALSLLASQGINEIDVYQDLKIAIFASGNELKEPWEEAQEHQIYNTNAITYHAILQEFGFIGEYQGILPDNKDAINQRIKSFRNYDVILTSGGVSVGEADFFEEVLRNNGAEILFHGIHLKPGHPTLFAKLDQTFIFALPGNPLSGAINLLALVIPTLKKLSQNCHYQTLHLQAKLKQDLTLKGKRSQMILGYFDGEYFSPFKKGQYGSASLLALQKSNAIAVCDENQLHLKQDEKIKIFILPYF